MTTRKLALLLAIAIIGGATAASAAVNTGLSYRVAGITDLG
ncbi:MAG: hypothetical protein ACLP4V_24795 [Methylocella sp.]